MSLIGYNLLNLSFRTDRKNYMLGNLQSMRVPHHTVRFHEGIYGLDYVSGEALVAAAMADGFPSFKVFEDRDRPRGDLACVWGTLRILRYIVSDAHHWEFGYYNQDDKLLMLPHPRLEQLISHLDAQSEKFLLFQMTFNERDAFLRRLPIAPVVPDGLIVPGIAGSGDSGLVVSKAGAAYLLDRFEKHPESGLEVLIGNLDPDLSGAYSVLDPSWLIQSLETKYWNVKNWRDDQDRILVNEEDADDG